MISRSMRSHPLGWSWVLILVAAALAVGCGNDSDSNEAGAAADGGGVIDTSNCPPQATETIEGDTIKIGSAAPLSGPYAVLGAAGQAAQAYYDKINAQGGVETVDGKKRIEFVLADNQYSPSKTQTEIRRLVEQEQVAAIAGLIGTAPTVAVSPYLNQRCVGVLWASGVQTGQENKYPFNTLYISNLDAGTAIGKAIGKQPGARVAFLYQNDDTGASTREGMEKGLAGSDAEIVEAQSYEATDTDVRAQMTTLAASDADVFVNSAVGDKCTQALDAIAKSDWRPKTVYFSQTCVATQVSAAQRAKGVDLVQPSIFKPLGTDDAGVEEFEQAMKEAGVDVSSVSQSGWAAAQLTVETLKAAKELTPVGLAEAARQLDVLPNTYRDELAPAPGTPFATRDYALAHWDEQLEQFGVEGEVINAAGG